jgi:DNA-binding transcriptional LysR family regulator
MTDWSSSPPPTWRRWQAASSPPWCGGDFESSWTIDTADGEGTIAIDPVLRLSSLVMIRNAARLGAGVARLPRSLVSREIARGRLVAWGDVSTSRVALWALFPRAAC